MGRCGREDDVTGPQYREPLPRGCVGHTGVRTKRAEVDELSAPVRAQAHESPEAGQVSNLAQGEHVALEVGCDIDSERLLRVEFMVKNAGV